MPEVSARTAVGLPESRKLSGASRARTAAYRERLAWYQEVWDEVSRLVPDPIVPTVGRQWPTGANDVRKAGDEWLSGLRRHMVAAGRTGRTDRADRTAESGTRRTEGPGVA